MLQNNLNLGQGSDDSLKMVKKETYEEKKQRLAVENVDLLGEAERKVRLDNYDIKVHYLKEYGRKVQDEEINHGQISWFEGLFFSFGEREQRRAQRYALSHPQIDTEKCKLFMNDKKEAINKMVEQMNDWDKSTLIMNNKQYRQIYKQSFESYDKHVKSCGTEQEKQDWQKCHGNMLMELAEKHTDHYLVKELRDFFTPSRWKRDPSVFKIENMVNY